MLIIMEQPRKSATVFLTGTRIVKKASPMALLVAAAFIAVLAAVLAPGTAWSAEKIQADRILVLKADRQMILYQKDVAIATYKIALGGNPKGHKTQQGDSKTPEGKYTISGRNPKSSFHLSLRISYPGPQDVAQARERGVDPGGDIMIHGLPPAFAVLGSLHRLADWTEGCIAVTNDEIESIWEMVPNGTPIEIRP